VNTEAGARPLLVFDGDCAFCTTSADVALRLFPDAFDAVPYQYADLTGLGLSAAVCRARLQWFDEPSGPGRPARPGNLSSGAQAVTALLRAGGRARGGLIGGAAWLVGVLAARPPLSWLAAAIYAAVAANRSRLPGGTPACRR
jgi:predicted DCC family thiol-disulfide oxidoreductase YuxK